MKESLSQVWVLPLQRGGTVAIALLLPSASFCTRAGQNMCPNFSRIRTVRGTVADWKVEVDVHAYVSIAFFAPS